VSKKSLNNETEPITLNFRVLDLILDTLFMDTLNTILMTTDTQNGTWAYSMELCSVLEKYNTQLHLATIGEPLSDSQQKEASELSNVEIHENNVSIERADGLWKVSMETGKWLLQLEETTQPDIVHLNHYKYGKLSWQNPLLIVVHTGIHSQWESVNGEPAPDGWNDDQQRIKEGVQRAEMVVGVSNAIMDDLRKYHGPFTKTEVIYNVRSSPHLYPKKKMPVIFSMGRLSDETNNISALNRIADSLFWPVFVAGDSPLDNHIEAGHLRLLGDLSPSMAAECFARASIFVMLARHEPFGFSIVDAALSECALILGDIPSLREIWGDAALYVDPDNLQELQNHIQELIQNPSDLKSIARKARERALQYSPDDFGRNYIELYQKVQGSGRDQGNSPRQTKTNPLSV